MLSFIWNNIFYNPILNIIVSLYSLLGNNFGLAVIAIAIIIRIILLPSMKGQLGMTKKLASLKPELEKLQKTYANNQEKLAQEQMKLYKKVGYNPLGCLTSFVPQIFILSVLNKAIRAISAGDLHGVYPFIQNLFFNGGEVTINPNFIIWDLTKSYTDIAGEYGNFAAISLYYLLLCILVGVSQYMMTKFRGVMQNPALVETTNKKKKKTNEPTSPEEMQAKMMNTFNFILPLSTVFIAISTASVLSVYWIAQSFSLLLQYFILDWDKTKKGMQNAVTILKNKRKKEKEAL